MKIPKEIDAERDKAALARAFSDTRRKIVACSPGAVVVIDYSDLRSPYGPN